jgi:cytochrome P450
MPALLTPPFPHRSRDWAPTWTAFVGRRANNSIYGWPEDAFRSTWKTRSVLGYTVHVVSDPDAIGRVLLDNKANYERPAVVRKLLSAALGDGLFNAEGESWREQRRIVAPTFSPAAVTGFAEPIARVTRERIAQWRSDRAPMDMAAEATATTMAIIAATLFNGDARLTAPAAAGHITAMLDAAGRARVTALLGLWTMGPGSGRARAGGIFLRETLGAIADERAAAGGGDDFFGGLVAALHARYPAAQARELAIDNAITFYVAGHETTANALTWTIYLLAAQPELQEELRAEAQAALAGGMGDLDARLPRPARSAGREPAPVSARAAAGPRGHGRRRGGGPPRPPRRPYVDLALCAAPASRAVGRAGRVRPRPLCARPPRGHAPLPISPVRGGTAGLRRCALCDRGGLDRVGALADRATLRSAARAAARAGRPRYAAPGAGDAADGERAVGRMGPARTSGR